MDLVRFFNTIRFLKPVQVYARLWFKFYRPMPDNSTGPDRRPVLARWVTSCRKPAFFFPPSQFEFLNVTRNLEFPQDWNNPRWDKLWLYNLHYFDDLQSGDIKTKKPDHCALIERWIQENPPGHGNGWEAYPLSLRIVNWIKWCLDGNELSKKGLQSLAVQARFLFKKIEYHLLGNHLFANAKALVFAGLFFVGPEAEAWLSKGLKILKGQIPEQILSDGGHFELSPMYHAIILEDLLDLINIMRVYGHGQEQESRRLSFWSDTAEKMLFWLRVMCHPDRKLSFFNDTALGIAREPERLEQYAKEVGVLRCKQPPVPAGVTALHESGYVRLQTDNAVLIADVGKIGPDYLPGHAHADCLSFEFSLRGQEENVWERVFVNSGISCYGSSEERLRQRGTASHNTLVINGENSSEVWGGFRVARRAYPKKVEMEEIGKGLLLKSGHDGYKRLKGKPLHWRQWYLTEDSLEIRDQISGGFFTAEAFFHLHPKAEVDLQQKKIYINQLILQYRTEAEVTLKETHYYPQFGRSVSNQCLVLKGLSPITFCFL